jgi:hypothetical protein
MQKKLALVCGVLAVMIGLGFVMPAIAELRQQGALPAMGVGLLLVGYSLVVGGGKLTIRGLTSKG